MDKNLDARIAIIGAGVSGLTVGLELQRRGYRNVVLFEKEPRVGGKTFSTVYKGVSFDLGSMMFFRPSEISELADQYGVSFAPFETKNFYYSQGKYLNPMAYTKRFASWFDIFRSMFGLRSVIASNRLIEPGFGDIDPELYQDFRSYLRSHHLEAAARAFEPAITGLGYGYYDATPAVYALKIMAFMMDTSLLRSVLTNGGSMCYFPGGWTELWEKVAAGLDVRLGSRISSIDRSSSRDVRMIVDGHEEIFDSLIVTAPLNHAHDYLDVSEDDDRLFQKIRSHRMISTLIEGSSSLQTVFLADNITPDRLGHVLGIEGYAPETRCAVLFQTVAPEMTTQQINQTLTEDIRALGCDVQNIVLQKEWEYFYYVSSQDLRDGFYASLNALQGKQRTFYSGSIMNFETIGHCQQFAKSLVQKYF